MINIGDILGDILKGMDRDAIEQFQGIPKDIRKELSKITVVGESGGGLVAVHSTGESKVQHVHIDASIISDEQVRKTLSDLLVAAFNAMQEKVEKETIEVKSKRMMSMLPGWIEKSK